MKTRHSITCASYLLLIKDEKILLLRRYNTGYMDGNYSVPAGHIDEGETLADALVRESQEEIGIDIDKKDVTLVHTMHRNKYENSDERIDFFFTCEKWSGEVINNEPHKCDDLSWFDLDNLPKNIIPYIKKGIEGYINKQPYSEFAW